MENNAVNSATDKADSFELPTPLFKVIAGHMAAGIFIAIVGLVFMLVFKSGSPTMYISICLVGLFLIARGCLIRYKWKHGVITEHLLRCVAVRKKYKSYLVLCTEPNEDEAEHLFEFSINRTRFTDKIFQGALMLIYIDKSSPRAPAAWKLLSDA